MKESKFIQQRLRTLTSYCYIVQKTYYHDHVTALRPRTHSFLDSLASTSTPACVSLSSLVQQLNDHQALNEISFLIILSMCEGNHLQISQEIHTHSRQSNLKNMARVFLLYLRQNIKPYTSYGLRLSWKFYRKKNMHDFRSIESNSRLIELDRIAHSILQLTQFQLYIKVLYFEQV